MIRQIINGKAVRTVSVILSEADATTLKGLMVGELQTWDSKATGGSSSNPAVLNYIGLSVGKTSLNGTRKSASVFIPHVKATKHFSDLSTAVVGVWDEDFNSSSACEYARAYNMKGEA